MAWLGSPRTARIYRAQNSRDLDTNKDYDTGGTHSSHRGSHSMKVHGADSVYSGEEWSQNIFYKMNSRA